MATTYTASDQNASPRAIHAGVNVVRQAFNTTVTLSVSDIIFVTKIPTGATIIDGYLSGTIDNSATILKLGVAGIGGADNNLITSLTQSATATLLRFNSAKLPVQVSVSDDAVLQYAWMYATVNVNASLTQTSSLQFVVMYAMKGSI